MDLKTILDQEIKKRQQKLLQKVGFWDVVKGLPKGAVDVAKKFVATGVRDLYNSKPAPSTFKEALSAGVKSRGGFGQTLDVLKRSTLSEVAKKKGKTYENAPSKEEVKLALEKFAAPIIGSTDAGLGGLGGKFSKGAKSNLVKKKYPTIHQGGKIKMVEGEPVKIIDGVETFIHKGDGGWVVSETSTGRFLADSVSKEGAIAKAKFNISNVGEEKFRKLIAEKQLSNKAVGGTKDVKESIPPTKTLKTTLPIKGQPPQFPSQIPQDISSYYNVDRLNISGKAKTAVKSEIEKAGDYLNKTVGAKLTNKEVLDASSETSRVVSKMVTREQTRAKIASNLRLRQQIAKTAESGKIDEDFVRLWVKDKSIGEDIARQLQARRINADPEETGFIDIILQSIYKVNQNADEIAKLAKDVDFNDLKQVTEFYRKFVKPKTSEWIDLLRYNSMLTSPNTHMVNTASNFQGTGLVAPVEKTITGLIDATKSALTGQPRKYAVGEGLAYSKGYFQNLGKASKRFMDVMRGTDVVSHPDINQIPLATKGAKKVAEKTLNLPLRLLDAMDKFFMTATEGGINQARALRNAKGIAFEGESVAKEAARRVFRTGSQDQGVLLNGVDTLTNTIMALRNSENPVISNIAKFTLPFVRTPTELFKQGIEYSPFGLATLPGAANKTEQVSKMLIGSATALGVSMLLGEDRLTWAEPINAKKKAEFRAAGRQPYSVKVGDNWISYSKLHPAMAFNFALIAGIDDAKKQQKLSEDDADSILQAFGKYANFMADQSYLRNIGDFVSGIKGEGFAKLAANYPQQLVPFRALSSWVERLTDPYQRQVDPNGTQLDKQMQYFIMQIPGWAQTLPRRQSQLGTPIENQNRLLNAFSPNRVTTEVPAFEGLYKIGEMESKMNRYKTEIKDMINKRIESKLLEATK